MRRAWLLAIAACGSDADAEPTCVDRAVAAAAYEHLDGNGTYANTACVVAGCHLDGSPGPAFHAAGTVMHRDRVTPQDGVTVRFRSQVTGELVTSAITDTAGNFFILATAPSPFPGIPEVTACPDTETMVGGTPNADYASCAAQTCHDRTGRGPITLD